jgi:Rad3-related DNA helicase
MPPLKLRPGQAEAVASIEAAFQGGARTVFLDAPVGSGKSLINLLVARDLRGAYISTPQTILVDQYDRDTQTHAKFADMAKTLYGRRNYPCPYVRGLPESAGGDPTATAEGAPCPQPPLALASCPSFEECPYYNAKREAQDHAETVTTLAYLLIGIRFGLDNPKSGWAPRPLLVVDEAHGLAEDLVQFYTLEIGPSTLFGYSYRKLKEPKDPSVYLAKSLPGYIRRAEKALAELRGSSSSATGSAVSQQRAALERQELDRQVRRWDSSARSARRILTSLRRPDVRWIHSYDPERQRHAWRPLSAAQFVSDFWGRFDRILLSSATFFGIETLVRDAGLPIPWARVTVPDTFPPERAPIHLLSVARLGGAAGPQEMEKAVSAVARIIEAHPAERGVIHANSYSMRDALQEGLPEKVRSRLGFHGRFDRTDKLDAWKTDRSTNSVFVAVSMHEGLDLVGDLARWQVIPKVPFPSSGDPWIQARKSETDGAVWYEERTMIDILQAAGRIMRAADDSGVTYILDSHFEWLLRKHWRSLPDWFRRRIEAGRRASPFPSSSAESAEREPKGRGKP